MKIPLNNYHVDRAHTINDKLPLFAKSTIHSQLDTRGFNRLLKQKTRFYHWSGLLPLGWISVYLSSGIPGPGVQLNLRAQQHKRGAPERPHSNRSSSISCLKQFMSEYQNCVVNKSVTWHTYIQTYLYIYTYDLSGVWHWYNLHSINTLSLLCGLNVLRLKNSIYTIIYNVPTQR